MTEITKANVTLTEEQIFNDLRSIATYKEQNERLAWTRKKKKLEDIISDTLQPIEERMLALLMEKQVILDEIEALRQIMVRECVHPLDYLVHKGDHVKCKFCDAKITLNRTLQHKVTSSLLAPINTPPTDVEGTDPNG